VRTVVVVQARSGSTRLPRKVLLPLGDRSLLERMLERLACARVPDAIVVATTTESRDDVVAALCARAGFPCYRGHPTDLLDRHYRVALEARADVIVKVPSDCPLIDPEVVDRVVLDHLGAPGRIDYTSNLHPESYPDGSDVEVMAFQALEAASIEATRRHEREHTTPFLWDQPERFVLRNVVWETGRDVSRTHRIVVDYAEDYEVVQAVFDALWTPSRPVFSVAEVVSFLDAHPHLRRRNAQRFGASWRVLEAVELRTERQPTKEHA
jgi:spore coat polysaccharide biosynthesis protein SpsF